MWTPVDLFYLCFLLNFSPDSHARLNVKEIIENKENKVIAETITLRTPQY
jgi:hypothetical protein